MSRWGQIAVFLDWFEYAVGSSNSRPDSRDSPSGHFIIINVSLHFMQVNFGSHCYKMIRILLLLIWRWLFVLFSTNRFDLNVAMVCKIQRAITHPNLFNQTEKKNEKKKELTKNMRCFVELECLASFRSSVCMRLFLWFSFSFYWLCSWIKHTCSSPRNNLVLTWELPIASYGKQLIFAKRSIKKLSEKSDFQRSQSLVSYIMYLKLLEKRLITSVF